MSYKQISVLFMSLFVAVLMSSSVAAGSYVEGKHYEVLPFPVKTNDPSKIEVVEAFWYGCPHCYDFNNNYLPAWEKSFADDVDFQYVPATFSRALVHAEAFYAAQTLKVLDKMHQPLFDAIQTSPNKYGNLDSLKDVFLANGVKEADFDKVFKAGGFRKISKVEEGINKAKERMKAYRIAGVPALVVNGKYKITIGKAGNFANMIKIANYLIDKERKLLKP